MRRRGALAVLAATPAWAATPASPQTHPDVLGAKASARGNDVFDFDVTVSSPYDTPQRYADAFRVMGPDGEVYGVRALLHDHAGEQPFTRDLYGVRIPPGVKRVTLQGRDRVHGWGGGTYDLPLPGR
ncbi:MAG: hypothetical protein OEU93_01865 [Rubrivivax sp.]|nr:hypothetical protein [Rubrivivax sp.]